MEIGSMKFDKIVGEYHLGFILYIAIYKIPVPPPTSSSDDCDCNIDSDSTSKGNHTCR